jgi:hypothetical protein
MTDTTNKFDHIHRLQQIATTIREVGGIADIFDSPATSAYDIECAIKEIERLHRDYSCICSEMRRMMDERDEARRLLKAVVDMMRDNMAPDATHPKHLCDFIHRPDIAMCKVCEDWTDAMVMCYPDDFQDEEETK